ncbi:G-protein coupled receptors family 1 profile domain-containing protein [Caenorhabditis elegans]|nr:G-protein coupled receptors family 1 profile domain-containing protein [Caenorhabditis elegans]CDR32624.1 G-protein coupled receptors family 1 profile domain-containing protein [Caenorhabditis elegans]|eukprot:NP_001293869.1 NeuroPeptide Receptor family [Caenorhabditis elegans]
MLRQSDGTRMLQEMRRKLIQLHSSQMINETEETCDRYIDKHPDMTNEPTVLVTFSLLYLHIFLLGILGNSAVLYLTMKHRQLQTVQNIFILNLCASNVLMCLTSLPITFITNVYKQWFFSSPVCKLIPLVQGASIFVSTFSLSAIALDRYNLVVRPHKQKLSSRSAMMIALLIWVISVVVCMPYGWYMDVEKLNGLCGEYCSEHWPLAEVRKGYTFLVLITQFLFPFATMAFCYYNIFSRLRQRVETKLKKLSERSQLLENSTTCGTTNHIVSINAEAVQNGLENKQRLAVLAQQRRTTTILSCMVLLFAFTWLPHNVVTLMIEYDGFFFHSDETSATSTDHTYIVSMTAHLISMLTNVTNPFLYAWLNPMFKEMLIKTLRGGSKSPKPADIKQTSFIRMPNSGAPSQSSYL